mmetsp:Transcript_32208/g.44177  ORF Transcript_32208/g.44177 Transcript_32208/m.44177 type:complete len:236 (+) Transcript_32208:628-1335(+)
MAKMIHSNLLFNSISSQPKGSHHNTSIQHERMKRRILAVKILDKQTNRFKRCQIQDHGMDMTMTFHGLNSFSCIFSSLGTLFGRSTSHHHFRPLPSKRNSRRETKSNICACDNNNSISKRTIFQFLQFESPRFAMMNPRSDPLKSFISIAVLVAVDPTVSSQTSENPKVHQKKNHSNNDGDPFDNREQNSAESSSLVGILRLSSSGSHTRHDADDVMMMISKPKQQNNKTSFFLF